MKLSTFTLEPIHYYPFSGPNIASVIPTTEQQREIWLSCSLGEKEANLAYSESVSLKLTGLLDKQALINALHDLVCRHESLRCTFSANGQWTFIYEPQSPALTEIDLLGLAPEEQAQQIQRFTKQEVSVSFHLTDRPLFRFTLHRLEPEVHLFTLTAHHIICDGWSLGILLEDLSQCYHAHCVQDFSQLKTPLSFSLYASEQRRFIGSAAYNDTLQYWKSKFSNTVPRLNMPLDYERPPVRTYGSNRVDYVLQADLVSAIKALGRSAGCSFVNTLLSAFELFIAQLTDQTDLCIGLPTAGQAATNNYFLTGHCVNLLPICSHINLQSSYINHLKTRKKQLLDDLEHQQLSFGKLLQQLHLQRDPSRIPLVPIVFNVDLGMDHDVRFDGLEHQLIYNPRICETFELFLNIADQGETLTLQWSYNTQLFKESTIRTWAGQFEGMLKQLANAPNEALATFIAPSSTSTSILQGKVEAWNQSTNVVHLLQEAGQIYRQKSAIVYQDQDLSYGELEEQSNRLAHYLIAQGASIGKKVAILLPRTPQMIVGLYAVLKTGATYVALDPDLPSERMHFILEDSDSQFLLSMHTFASTLHFSADFILLDRPELNLSTYPSSLPTVHLKDNDIVYILYTSGSTGTPKGVQVTHSNVVNFLHSAQSALQFKSTDRILAITTIAFDISVVELLLPLLNGSTIVLADDETTHDQRKLLQLIDNQQISIVQATPSRWQLLIQAAEHPFWPIKAISTGEPLSKNVAENLLGRCEELWNGYGPTETTVWSTLKRINTLSLGITIGKPLHNTAIYILDENQHPVHKGQIGEIYIAGWGVTAGYYKRPELNKSAFLDIPFDSPYPIMYKTGDLGKINEEDEIEYLGRSDQQVKLRGYRIELDEISYQLAKLPDIREAIVSVHHDTMGDQRLVAYLLMHAKATDMQSGMASKEQIHSWRKALAKQLPSYMLPNDWICLDQFPLTPNQKVDRKRLPAPQQFRTGKQSSTTKSTHQELIQQIWQETLGLQFIDLDDDFFELGGHSLIAAQVMLQLEQQTGKRLPLSTLFEYPTLRKLSALILSESETPEPNCLVAIKTSGSRPPLYLVHGGGLNVLVYQPLAKYLTEDQPLYALQAIGLDGKTVIPDTIEEISRIYLAEVLQHNPEGPYALAGYSLGGIIAYEMARQLLELGKEVSLLGIMDTNAGGRDWQLPAVPRILKKTARQFKKLKHIAQSVTAYPSETVYYHAQGIKRICKQIMGISIEEDEDVFSREYEIAVQYDKAYNQYRFQPLPLKIHLFRVTKRLYYLDDPIYLGWKDYALKGIEVCSIPGDHKTFLFEPNDAVFARTLEQKFHETYAWNDLQPTT